MVREYIVRLACLLMLVSFTVGIILQVELMQPGIYFMSESLWPHFITLHVWSTPISLLIIVLSTVSLIRHRTTFGQWAIWIGFSTIPLLLGAMIHFVHMNAQSDNILGDTLYRTAYLHGYGTAALMIALGGLSAMRIMKYKNMPILISIVFALLIASSGTSLTLLQARLGLIGMPSRYIDYPHAFAGLQFYSSIAAIACFGLSIAYVIFLWRLPNKNQESIKDVF